MEVDIFSFWLGVMMGVMGLVTVFILVVIGDTLLSSLRGWRARKLMKKQNRLFELRKKSESLQETAQIYDRMGMLAESEAAVVEALRLNDEVRKLEK